MSAPEPVLEAIAVDKVYPGGVTALHGVDLQVKRGETVALIGESGCGKTTLLRLFNRMVEPTAGTVRVDGAEVARLDPIPLRRRLGYVQQEGGLIPHWTVRRNVELVPELLGWEAERRARRRDEVLQLVGLPPETFSGRYPLQLSGGQRQRVALARALAAEPEVILLDEPFGALDALTRLELQEQFRQLKERLGKTMVLVTHDLDEAFRLADRVAVLRAGCLLQVAPPAELAERPATEYIAELLRRGQARHGAP